MTDTPDTSPGVDHGDDSLDLPQNLEAAKRLRSENRNLRERLRTLESDYEAAVTRYDAMQMNEVQRVAAEHLIDPADIWTTGKDFYDEYGMPDPEKIATAATTLLTEKPHLGTNYKPTPAPPSDRPIEGLRPGATPSDYTPEPQPTWSEAISSRVGPLR
ncbi:MULTISPECIES: hypothetical protein [Mycobacterium]|uniref:Uncharacterized protein n=1 Tax=Mycobacterium kiyosense TaxID=2871094 RepID=A0A9P3UYL7_9MYCO|nr:MULTISPECIES: hypothetical protein [Mycobacterium]BDB45385.1 hypothetical protein IWGMT90018_58310 [Mycobacterium kiyosense]BDE16849.1 hypothetical protein MKCMC460_57090 [Mycobacterium sp. 20KCMC460]GLB83067.1 hypothetical protein SRL2020028_23230 [Mycobacterium kiyosense]GLB90674.1 hypothetical protein SRL2020130_34910 [Mycobacterium kiyosense]GLB97423.1 hypothetical protein SRL2020226_41990 [Mycobacterium kiyosense]